MNAENIKTVYSSRVYNRKAEHTTSWVVIMCTLSHIITISFCFDLHSISTYIQMKYNFSQYDTIHKCLTCNQNSFG